MSSRNTHITLSKTSKRNLRKKELRTIKRAKVENPNSSIIKGGYSSFNSSINQIEERTNIFYDPQKHKTQSETRCSTKSETCEYIRTRWISEDFLSEDLKSTKVSQPYTLSNPEFTFVKKFLEKREQRRLSRNNLLVMDTTGPNNNITNSLPPRTIQPIPTNDFEIPTQYMALLESEIFNFNKCFHHHCRHLWSKVKHVHQEAQKKIQKIYNISEAFGRLSNYKLDVAEKTTRDMATDEKFESYYHVFNPQCFRNFFDEVVVNFFDLVKPTDEEDAIA
ncbi:21866_t:CDS:2, partial [Gigaspora margarita]